MRNSGNLHVLLANNIYPPIMAGGAELIVQYVAEGLAAKGHQVTVVSTCGPEMEPYPVENRNGVEIIRFFPKNLYWHFTRGDRPGYQKALWHLRDAWNTDAGKKFNAVIEERKPDILHTHLIDGMSAILWKRAREHNIPVVHTAHDYHLICPRSVMLTRSLKICTNPSMGCKVFRKWHLNTTQQVDIFCSPSKFLLEQHVSAGLKAKRTAIVPNGVPLPPRVQKERNKNAPRRFLFISRLTAEKGCQLVLDAIKLLPQQLPFELCVAGKGVFEPVFREAAAADPRIRVLGYISGEEKTSIFRSSDCLVFPSLWYEAYGLVAAEAAAYGMGVIGSRIGAIPEIVTDGVNGILFEPGNAGELAAAMRRVIAEEGLAERLAAGGQSLVERSTVNAMVEGYLRQYETAMSS